MAIKSLTLTESGMARMIRDQLGSGYTPSTVIRELFQNADDAGATKLVIGFHPGLPKHPEALRRRPGFVVMNNGPVLLEDVQFLSQLKANQRASDPYTIGRFGIGKVALFNWADAYYLDVAAGDVQCGDLITVFPDLWEAIGDDNALKEPIRDLASFSSWLKDEPRLALWLPIRTAGDRQTILRFEKSSLPSQQWIRNEATWVPYLRMLPMLRHLRSMEIWEWDSEDIPKRLLEIHLEGEQRHPKLLEKLPSIRSFQGRIQTSSQKVWQYWGQEQRLPDVFKCSHNGETIQLHDLKAAKEWPVNPENQNEPELKIPHGAVLILHREGTSETEIPDITQAAFLPLGDRNLGHRTSQVVFHANGFLDEQRSHFLGMDGSEDQKVLADWNQAIMGGATLPLLPAVMEKALAEQDDAVSRNWVEALAKHPLILANPQEVSLHGCFTRVLHKEAKSDILGWHWRAVEHKEHVVYFDPSLAESLKDTLAPLVAGGITVVDQLAPKIGNWNGALYLSQPVLQILWKFAQEQSAESFQSYVQLLNALVPQLQNSEKAKIPIPIHGRKFKIEIIQNVEELHRRNLLWIEDDTSLFSDWTQALETHIHMWLIAPSLHHIFKLGAALIPYNFLNYLDQYTPALSVSFVDRLPLIRQTTKANMSSLSRRTIRYLLHASAPHVNDNTDLLIDIPLSGSAGATGVLQDLMNHLASEAPSWTRLPEEAGQVFSADAQRWLGLRTHDDFGTLKWALDYPEKVVPPHTAVVDEWNAEALCLLANHLRQATPGNLEAWARLPLHRDIQGKYGPIQAKDSYNWTNNSPAWVPEGVQVLRLYEAQDPMYVHFSSKRENWSNQCAIDWILAQPEPWRYAIEILNHLKKAGGYENLPRDLRSRFEKLPWIPIKGHDSGTALPYLVRLPAGKGCWRDLLDNASGIVQYIDVAYYTEASILSEVRNHPAWKEYIHPLFKNGKDRVFQITKLVSASNEDFSLGFTGMIQRPAELAILTRLEVEGIEEGQAPRLALELLTALCSEELMFEDLEILLSAFANIRASTALELKALFHALGQSAQTPGLRWEGSEMAFDVFKHYLENIKKNLETKDFQNLAFPNQEGKWHPANHFPDPQLLDRDKDRAHLLDQEWQDLILGHSFEWPIPLSLVTHSAEIDLSNYFKPWLEEGVPPAYIACLLGVFGGAHHAAALEYLKNHAHGGEGGLRVIRAKLHFDGDLMAALTQTFSGDEDIRKSHAFDQHHFHVSIARKQQIRIFAGLDGNPVELHTAQNILVEQVVPKISIRAIRNAQIPGGIREVELRLASPLTRNDCQNLGASVLMDRIKDGTREILEKVYCNNYQGDEEQIRRRITGNYWDELWDEFLAHQEQLHLRIVQAGVKGNLHHTVKLLFKDIDSSFPGKNTLQELKDAYHEACRAQAEARARKGIDPRSLAKFGDALSRAEDAFVNALDDDPNVERALRSGVQRHIQKRQYSPDRILFELYQNAEDAYRDWETLSEFPRSPRPEMEYVLIQDPQNASLNTLHWGRPICHYQGGHAKQDRFRDDLENMLTFNLSSKNETNVGEHGLGFKSVHLISDCPIVISGSLAFQIKAGIYPICYEPSEQLPEFLQKLAPKPPGDLGTLIHLPTSRNLSVDPEELIKGFWNCAEPLLAFSRKIRTIRIILATGKETTLQWQPRTLWAEGDLSIEWARPSRGSQYFRIGDAHHVLLLRFNENCALEPLSGTPTLWALAPTKQNWGSSFKVLLQAPFALDQGRTRLGDADAEENRGHFTCLGQKIRRALQGWLGQADPFRGLPMERDQFIKELWEGFGSPLGRFLSSAGDQAPYAKALHDGIIDLWRLDSTGPDGFGGFASAESIKTVLRGSIWDNPEFQQYALENWNELLAGCILESRWNNGLDKYRGKESKPSILGEGDFLRQVLGTPFSVNAYRDLNRILAVLPEDQQATTIHALQTVGPHFIQTMDSTLGRTLHEIALHSDENGLLWALAPDDGQVNIGYSNPSESLLARLRQGEIKPDLILNWCSQGWGDPSKKKAIQKYLQDGKYASILRPCIVTYPNIPDGLKAYVEGLLANFKLALVDIEEDLPATESDEPLQCAVARIDGRATLQAIYDWWMDLEHAGRQKYVDLYSSGLEAPDLLAMDSSQKKIAWLKLLAFGAGHTIGRYDLDVLRAFIKKGPLSEAQWEMMATQPPSLNDSQANHQWMNLLNQRLENESDFKTTYDHLFRVLFGPLHRFAYSLETYIFIIAHQSKRKEHFSLEKLAWVGGDPLLTGSGLGHLPSLYQALGYGLVAVMRELQRLEVVKSPYLVPHGFVPYKATRNFLNSLAWEDPQLSGLERPTIMQSQQIYNLVVNSLGMGRDLTFGGCFDIPILAVARTPELQEEILGTVASPINGPSSENLLFSEVDLVIPCSY